MDNKINMEEYLKLANMPPTATVIIKQEKKNVGTKLKHWWKKLKDKTTFKDVFLWLSIVLNIELIIAVFSILAILA